MNVFKRSWNVTKATFGVMSSDREMYFYPILSFFFSVLFLVLLGFIALSSGFFLLINGSDFGMYELIFVIFAYFGVSFISTFFSTCVVYTAGTRFNGGNAGFWSSIGFSFKRIHKIFLWSVISASVGMLFRVLEKTLGKIKGFGKLVLGIINIILGLAWSILTIFVIQGIVYHDLGPFSAIKKSVYVLKKTWGESLIKYFGMGVIQFLFIFAGLLVGIPAIVLLSGVGFMISGFVLLFLYLMGVTLVFSVANQVFDTALYVYAHTGKVPEGYSEEIMKNAFKSQKMGFA